MIRKPTVTIRKNQHLGERVIDEAESGGRLFERGSRSRWAANWILAFVLFGGSSGGIAWAVTSAGDGAESEISSTRRTVAAGTDELAASLEGVEDLDPEIVAKIIKFINCDIPEIRRAVGLETEEPDCDVESAEPTEEASEEDAIATTIPG